MELDAVILVWFNDDAADPPRIAADLTPKLATSRVGEGWLNRKGIVMPMVINDLDMTAEVRPL